MRKQKPGNLQTIRDASLQKGCLFLQLAFRRRAALTRPGAFVELFRNPPNGRTRRKFSGGPFCLSYFVFAAPDKAGISFSPFSEAAILLSIAAAQNRLQLKAIMAPGAPWLKARYGAAPHGKEQVHHHAILHYAPIALRARPGGFAISGSGPI
jgi:hypothetical protein